MTEACDNNDIERERERDVASEVGLRRDREVCRDDVKREDPDLGTPGRLPL
jgi:hypothetical protein